MKGYLVIHVALLALVYQGVLYGAGSPWYTAMALVQVVVLSWSVMVYAGSARAGTLPRVEPMAFLHACLTSLLLLSGELFLGIAAGVEGVLLTTYQWHTSRVVKEGR